MRLFKNKYRMASARLSGWDYSEVGYYFVTICTKGKVCWFGEIEEEEIKLSKYGKIAEKCWLDLVNHYMHISLEIFVIMPNHIHSIVVIESCDCRDGACPVSTLGNIVGSFKSAVSKQIHLFSPDFSWQSRYYDHVIRNDKSLANLRQYIANNPKKWDIDKENPKFK